MFRLFLYESNRRCLISVRPRPPLTDIFEDVRSGRPELRAGSEQFVEYRRCKQYFIVFSAVFNRERSGA